MLRNTLGPLVTLTIGEPITELNDDGRGVNLRLASGDR